ncbi:MULTISPECIES: hypothetical protein [unclassified Pseudarthrobacter]|uniref:hypothetical protein n=1 Tax=unclassified Pseudarthrobacter TaxID=2647000 RepID=UPI00113006C5|nr:hypothetical protein [Pseudarthrobacter sp. NIBRBAC000502772]QDG68358.1 hypothetical protein NIBR502772_21020 [Pseudarthrobacter sp. NIBRBAC000502772]
MKTPTRRFVMLSVAIPLAFTAGLPAAQAANPNASCVGIIVSSEAPAGEFDVDTYKDLAESVGVSPFGQFVVTGARLHEGSMEACLP